VILALTPGEPAGIAPDLCVMLAQQQTGSLELALKTAMEMVAAGGASA
jgi:4-hydroxy-L-threonine phosphate dehydrogenase PdxA